MGGQARCALPSGNVGMQLFQRAVREQVQKAKVAGIPMAAFRPQILHCSCFNPIEATDSVKMHDVLSGKEVLQGKWVCSIHIFRQVRDDWKQRDLTMPQPLAPKVSD